MQLQRRYAPLHCTQAFKRCNFSSFNFILTICIVHVAEVSLVSMVFKRSYNTFRTGMQLTRNNPWLTFMVVTFTSL